MHHRVALYSMLTIIFFACSAHAQWNVEEISPSTVGQKTGLVVVDGRPAVVFWVLQVDPSHGFLLSYTRATDVEGSSWSAPVILATLDFGDNATPSLELVGGIPMYAYIGDNGDTDVAFLVTSKDALGAEWNDPAEIPTGTGTVQWLSFVEVNGKPAIAFITSSALKFIMAATVDGTSWNAPVTIESGIQPGFISLAVVDGRPAICYQQRVSTNKDRLDFVIAADADGSSWNEPVNIVQPTGATSLERKGYFPSLVVVDGRPAVAYYDVDPSRDLMFAIAKTTNGSSWNDPVTVDSEGDAGNTASLAVVNGYPAIAYRGAELVKFVIATNVTGSSWAEPVVVDSEGIPGYSPTLAIVDGEPAISYTAYIAENGTRLQRYARFKCAAGTLDCDRDYSTCETMGSCVCDPECDSGTAECTYGTCACLTNNLRDCDEDGSSCEVDTSTDNGNCGECDYACDTATTQCAEGVCACLASNLRDCDEDGHSCEVNILSDDQNCGECGYECNTATATCVDGVCECLNENLRDCDEDGHSCEVDTLSDAQNCGQCGSQCDSATTVGCVNGICKCAAGLDKENADALSCALLLGSPPCPAGYGADLENDLCVDCAQLLSYSPGGSVGCQACASECEQCNASSGECVGAATREWCLLQGEAGSMSACEACGVQFFATVALLSACGDQVRVSVDCGLVSESPQGILHTAFTLYLECNGVRSLMQDFAELLNVRLRQEDRKRLVDRTRSSTVVSDPLLVWWSGTEWIPACTGCSAECTEGYSCHQGEHSIHSTVQVGPTPAPPEEGNTPGTPPRPIPGTSTATTTTTGSIPVPVPAPIPSPSPSSPSPTPSPSPTQSPADSSSRLFLHFQYCVSLLLFVGLFLYR